MPAKNFFISYNKADKAWAEWVAWQLEASGYTTVVQVWDFKAGNNFALEMQKAADAERTVAILSTDYLQAEYTQPEWTAAFAKDPTGTKRTLILIRVEKCDVPDLLKSVVYIDCVNLAEDTARQQILQQISNERAKPKIEPGFPGKKQQPGFPGVSESIAKPKDSFQRSQTESKPNSVDFQKHIRFQNQIRIKIEKELAKETLKPLRDGFIEIVWSDKGKVGDPTVTELVNELFIIDPATGCADSEAILAILLRGTEACLEQLDNKGEKISASDFIWKAAKQILGWLTTLAIRSEALANSDDQNGFDEIDVETLIGVEVYTARTKDIAADFQADPTGSSAGNFKGGKQIDPGFFPEAGWQAKDVIDQIRLIVWEAVGNKKRSTPLTDLELEQLNTTLRLHRTRRKNSLNYHFAVRKSAKHPLLITDICSQITTQLPELTIVHIGTETDNGTLLMISEGILVAHIEAFLNLIDQYQ